MRNVRTLLLFISIITHGIYAQEICPIENPSVLGGDSQNIIAWNEPANPFLVTFTVSITPDSWPTEISWGLVNSSGDSVAGAAPGDLTNAGEVYTWDNEIEHGSYTFTIYDTFGDGNSGGFILYIDGSAIFTFDGSEAYTEYEVVLTLRKVGLERQQYLTWILFLLKKERPMICLYLKILSFQTR